MEAMKIKDNFNLNFPIMPNDSCYQSLHLTALKSV